MSKLVPIPSKAMIPERDLEKRPVLETHHLGVEFGGLKAVDDLDIIIGKTEIAGLKDRTEPERLRYLTFLQRCISRLWALYS